MSVSERAATPCSSSVEVTLGLTMTCQAGPQSDGPSFRSASVVGKTLGKAKAETGAEAWANRPKSKKAVKDMRAMMNRQARRALERDMGRHLRVSKYVTLFIILYLGTNRQCHLLPLEGTK